MKYNCKTAEEMQLHTWFEKFKKEARERLWKAEEALSTVQHEVDFWKEVLGK